MKTLLRFRDLELLAFQGDELRERTISSIYYDDNLQLFLPRYVFEIMNNLGMNVLEDLVDLFYRDMHTDIHALAYERLKTVVEYIRKKRMLDIKHVRSIGDVSLSCERYMAIVNGIDEESQVALFHTLEFWPELYQKIIDICIHEFADDKKVAHGVYRLNLIEEQLRYDIADMRDLYDNFADQDEFLCVDNVRWLGETRDNLLASVIRIKLAEWMMYDELAADDFVQRCRDECKSDEVLSAGVNLLEAILKFIK